MNLNEFLKINDIKPNRYQKNGKVTIVDTKNGTYAIKETKENKQNIYNYLNSRQFRYYPKIINNEEEFEVTEYIEEIETPEEQKILDLIDLVSLLHNKTTFYKEIDEDYYKEIYEDLSGNIEYLEEYYTDTINIIESEIYMKPSNYLLARNISIVFSSINYIKQELEKWYELVQDNKKTRLVVLHNNLSLKHFIKNSDSYLISWDKSKIDMPIFDLYKLYKNNGLNFDFEYILKRYEKKYPLKQEERILLFILIAMPPKIEPQEEEYEMCKTLTNYIDLMYKTEKIITSYQKEEK